MDGSSGNQPYTMALGGGRCEPKRLGRGAPRSIHLPRAGYGKRQSKWGQRNGPFERHGASGGEVKGAIERPCAPHLATVQLHPLIQAVGK